MRNFYIALVWIVSAWFIYSYLKKPARHTSHSQQTEASVPAQIPAPEPNAAVRYTNALQGDIQKADAARDKMNAAIQQSSKEIEKAAQDQP